VRDDDDDDFEDDEPRRRPRREIRRGKYADCPHCGNPGDATRVGFTWWGGLIGPALLCHVRCRECGTCYNGRSGNYNTVGITIYTLVGVFFGLLVAGLCLVGNILQHVK
jgi:hypothetical protein